MRRLRNSLIVIALLCAFVWTACEINPNHSTPPAPEPNKNAATTNRPDPNAAKPVTETIDWAATLPALNVALSEDTFVRDLKTKLNLGEEQLVKLKVVAREGALNLQSVNSEREDASQSRKVGAKVENDLKAAIGEGAQQLPSFIASRASAKSVPANMAFSCTGPPDTRVVVNAPAFRMDVFENGQPIKSYKVAIGYPEYPLPIGVRTAETIIFNPSWTPPDSAWVEAYNSKVKPGETIEPGDSRNPLGVMKIPLGAATLIHGGKNPAQVGSVGSHGCVGLTNAQARDFAKVLARLGGNELSDDQISEYEKAGTKTETVKLNRPVPVELRYDTITVENGQLHVYRDVYASYTDTEQTLRAVLGSCGLTFEQLAEHERAQAMTALSEMSRDAAGRPLAAEEAAGATGEKSRKNKETAVRVTRVIKGKKEAVVDIAARNAKGYPAPTDVDTGQPAPPQRPQRTRRR